MTYKSGNFVQRDPERRKLRDQKRNAFFSELELDRVNEPLNVSIPHGQRLDDVVRLMAQTIELHEGDKSGLQLAARAISELGLCGTDFSPPVTRSMNITSYIPEALRHLHFDTRLLEWLDDER